MFSWVGFAVLFYIQQMLSHAFQILGIESYCLVVDGLVPILLLFMCLGAFYDLLLICCSPMVPDYILGRYSVPRNLFYTVKISIKFMSICGHFFFFFTLLFFSITSFVVFDIGFTVKSNQEYPS